MNNSGGSRTSTLCFCMQEIFWGIIIFFIAVHRFSQTYKFPLNSCYLQNYILYLADFTDLLIAKPPVHCYSCKRTFLLQSCTQLHYNRTYFFSLMFSVWSCVDCALCVMNVAVASKTSGKRWIQWITDVNSMKSS